MAFSAGSTLAFSLCLLEEAWCKGLAASNCKGNSSLVWETHPYQFILQLSISYFNQKRLIWGNLKKCKNHKYSNPKQQMYLRCSIDKSKGDSFLLVFWVYIIAAWDFLLEVIMDHTGIVLHLQLSHPWDTQQQVLIIDVRLGIVCC